jgi:hypothetical protein
MRTAYEIQEQIHDAMVRAKDEIWDDCTNEERAAYRLVMHGIEMCVAERKPTESKVQCDE